MGVVAAALCLSMSPVPAAAQDANMSTTVASLGSGTTSLIKLDAVTAKPATDRGPALPSLAVTDDGSGPRVRNLVLELPDLDLGDVAVASIVDSAASLSPGGGHRALADARPSPNHWVAPWLYISRCGTPLARPARACSRAR
jgi:hypothetical protein